MNTMKRIWWVVPLVGVLIVGQACESAWASVERVSLTTIQDTDSVRFVPHWSPSTDQRNNLVPVYNWVLWDVLGDTLLEQQSTLWLSDTSKSFTILPGDSMVVYARVQGVDDRGMEGGWGQSPDFIFTLPDLFGPSVPTVNVDTVSMMLVLDSLVVFSHGPPPYNIPIDIFNSDRSADTLRFAAVLYSGSSAVECCCSEITDPPGTHPCDQITLVGLRGMTPGDYVPYRRADFYEMYGDSTKFSEVGAKMQARGMFVHPEIWNWRREMFAWTRTNVTVGS